MTNKRLNERKRYQLRSLASRVANIGHAMSAEELGSILGVSRLTILRRAKRGTIPCFRVGSLVKFDPANIARWLVQMGDQRMSKG
jgi:excisionase family DNA binding protein